ncbi:MAG TPA: septal ring lytic transglycosylase RlpA family protein [Chitinophagaceae bacterium]|jgi:rare lipoprotein A|nr:septal ring lytic transglycosylase RlpA family protein [Chitinophagaceae bacterium]
MIKKFYFSILGLAFIMCLFSFTNIKKVAENKWNGVASYYHAKFHGRKTATGEVFSNAKMTAANNFLKLGTLVKVTNLTSGKSVIVKINDRMNANNHRLIDLSQAAAKKIGIVQQGVGNVSIEVLSAATDYLANR